MKFTWSFVLTTLLFTIISVGCTGRGDSTASEKTVEESNISSSVPAEAVDSLDDEWDLKEKNTSDNPLPSESEEQSERVVELISLAGSVDYKVNGEWVPNSDNIQEFIQSIQDLIPENLGETATFYNPDSIILKYHLPTPEQHMLSIQDRKVSVNVSSVEISNEGILFLMPQGMSLGVISDVQTILPEQ